MSKRIPLGVFILCLIFVILVTFMTTYVLVNDRPGQLTQSSTEYTEEQQKIIDKLVTIDNIYSSDYIEDIDYNAIIDSVIRGYVSGTGDRYGQYMDDEMYSAFNETDIGGSMTGIGIIVVYDSADSLIEIVYVVENSPAQAAGLLPGDRIKSVSGQSVVDLGYTDAINHLYGEEGTFAEFTVIRGESNEEISFSVKRAKVASQNVFYHVYQADKSIGIVRIDSFSGNVVTQFENAITDLQSQGVEKFVFDVRSNPGGELNMICEVLDKLLPDGPIVRMIDKDGAETGVIFSDSKYIDIPMVVLTDGNTASAAELFACALKDYAKAGKLSNVTLVGTTTFGKGSMQNIYNLKDGTGLRVSIGLYNPPYSENYNGVGVIPDVEVELAENLQNTNFFKISDEEDNQLQAAIEILNKDKNN